MTRNCSRKKKLQASCAIVAISRQPSGPVDLACKEHSDIFCFFLGCGITLEWLVTVEKVVHLSICIFFFFTFYTVLIFSPLTTFCLPTLDCCPAHFGFTCASLTQTGFVALWFPPVSCRLCLLEFMIVPVCLPFSLNDSCLPRVWVSPWLQSLFDGFSPFMFYSQAQIIYSIINWNIWWTT